MSSIEAQPSHSAVAGHWGKDVRSDLHVNFEARTAGGIEIVLESRVASYYGGVIEKQTRDVLSATRRAACAGRDPR